MILFDKRSESLPTSFDAYAVLDKGLLTFDEVAEFLEIRNDWRRPVWYRNVRDMLAFLPDLVIDAILLLLLYL